MVLGPKYVFTVSKYLEFIYLIFFILKFNI